MEIVIVICLIIVIVLLLEDRFANRKRVKQKPEQEKVNPVLPDIMGQPKPAGSHPMPNMAKEHPVEQQETDPANLDIEYDENEIAGIQILQEEPDEVFGDMPDLEKEEEEWSRHGISGNDNSLAQGVTYDELSAVGALLQNENLELAQKETAAAIVQRLKGTELFNLLENSIEGASRRIAKLLDSTLSPEAEDGSSILHNDDLEGFDIGEFI